MTEEEKLELDLYIQDVSETPIDSIVKVIHAVSGQLIYNKMRYTEEEVQGLYKMLISTCISMLTKSFFEDTIAGNPIWLVDLFTRIQDRQDGFEDLRNILTKGK